MFYIKTRRSLALQLEDTRTQMDVETRANADKLVAKPETIG